MHSYSAWLHENSIGHSLGRRYVVPEFYREGTEVENYSALCRKKDSSSFYSFQIRTMDRLTRRRIARQASRNLVRQLPSSTTSKNCDVCGSENVPFQIRRQRQRPQGPPQPQGPPDWLLPIPVPPNARGQVAYHPYDCMTLGCLCPFFAVSFEVVFVPFDALNSTVLQGRMQGGHCVLSNGAVLRMAYRKEYRMLTDDERNRWHNALTTLKMNGEYDRLSRQHFEVSRPFRRHQCFAWPALHVRRYCF